MKKTHAVIAVLALAVSAAASAQPQGKGKGKADARPAGPPATAPARAGTPRFEAREATLIQDWYRANPGAWESMPPGLARQGKVPPGLAKQGKVPPGWEKKMARGEIIPGDIWAHRVPLPHEILGKLPPSPPGVETVRIHDKVVRVHQRTREILDVVGLPHP
jgi:hypothetical protein